MAKPTASPKSGKDQARNDSGRTTRTVFPAGTSANTAGKPAPGKGGKPTVGPIATSRPGDPRLPRIDDATSDDTASSRDKPDPLPSKAR